MSNFFVQELVLYRHFMLIDSPIPFELVANPTNLQKDNQGNIINPDKSLITGRDICSRPAGAWRVDCWTLLPEKYHKLNPVFTMLIKYDMDLLAEGEKVDIRYSDIDVGEGVAGVNGQLVNIRAEDLRPVVLGMEAQGELTRAKLDSLDTTMASVQSAQADSNALLSAVRDAVLEVNNGSVNNKLEQIRTVLKSSISSPSPFADLETAIDSVKTAVENSGNPNFNLIRSTDWVSRYVGYYRPIFPMYYDYHHDNTEQILRVFSVFHQTGDDCILSGFDIANNTKVSIHNFNSWPHLHNLWI